MMTSGSRPTSAGLACVIAGRGPDLVLLHGGVGSASHWVRNIPGLSRDHRVCAIDLPGFGDSPGFPVGADDQFYFDWVASAITAEASGPIRLVGFSFGGTVAAAVAPLLDERLTALTLVAPGSFGVPERRNVQTRPIRHRAGEQIDPREGARHNLAEVMFFDPASADDAAVDLHLHNVERARYNSRRLSWQDRLTTDLVDVDCPIQMIWGAQDRMATPSIEARIERCRTQLRQAIRFDVIQSAGHWVQYEQPAAFNETLLTFLRSASMTKEDIDGL